MGNWPTLVSCPTVADKLWLRISSLRCSRTGEKGRHTLNRCCWIAMPRPTLEIGNTWLAQEQMCDQPRRTRRSNGSLMIQNTNTEKNGPKGKSNKKQERFGGPKKKKKKKK